MENWTARDCLLVLLSVFFGIALVISSIAWPIAYYNVSTYNTLVREGYEQTSLPGQNGVYWVKK